ncbi:MAG: hypothetical protein VXY92_03810 [Planctomycetota bacterium]|nr:hypothetical protein [Planctomycetota bacterium]
MSSTALSGTPLKARAAVAAIASTVLALVAVRLAWLGDDAYITLRTVESWAQGLGLRWNPSDRVQTYTHPLWMLTLACGRWLSGEVYFTTLGISLVLSLGAAWWLMIGARTAAAAAATGAVLVSSRAFCDYTTSGLEVPLTAALLLAFVGNALADRAPVRRYTAAVLLANLLTLNRMDLALLCLPSVLAAMRGVPLRDVLLRGALLSTPFFAWLAFAGVYYGSPFPVTAHAKAFGVGIPASEVMAQGLRYVLHTATADPATFLVSALGPLTLLARPRTRWLAVGALCYLAYVVKVGGGFMQGRFFLPPFVVTLACLVHRFGALSARGAAWTAGAALAALLAGGWPAWATRPSEDAPMELAEVEAQHGIVDERRMYYRELGLLSPTRQVPKFAELEQLAFPEGREARWWLLNGAVGVVGFRAGADGHVVDPLLCDPLVARLPARDPSNWRIGHVLRRLPEGYWESLRDDANRIHHPGLRRYYDALRSLTRAPVFSSDRLAHLQDMALGRRDADLRAFLAEDYYDPPRIAVDVGDLATPLPSGAYWFDEPGVCVVYEGGLEVRLTGASAARKLQLQVLGLCRFRVRFLLGDEVVGDAFATPAPTPPAPPLQQVAGLRNEVVVTPAGVATFDGLWIDAVEIPGSDKAVGPAGLGSVRLTDG